MKKLVYLSSLFLLSSLFVCCSRHIEESRIDVSFSDSIHDSVFQMSQLYGEKYDSFYVLRPYFPVDSLGQLEMSDGLKEFLESRLMFDDAFIILLSEASTVKAYSEILRNDVVGFKMPYGEGISMDVPLTIASDSIHTGNFVKFMEE